MDSEERSALRRGGPAVETAVYVASFLAAGTGLWATLSVLHLSLMSLPLTLVGSAVMGLLRARPVQLLLGGGRLDNRPALRVALGGSAFLWMLCLCGLPWMISSALAVVVLVHLSWSGYRSWASTAVVVVVMASAVQVAVVLGWLPSLIDARSATVVAVVQLALTLALGANAAVLMRDRERTEAELGAERELHHADLLHAATHDRLTGLLDRDAMGRRLDEAVAAAAPGAGVALLFCDLDGFKAVNDTLGHRAGDELLLEASTRLVAAVRPDDHVARVGGDEFLVLLTEVEDHAAAVASAARIEEVVSALYELPSGRARVGVSIGVAFTDDPAASVARLVGAADSAMYGVKGGRRARSARSTLTASARWSEPSSS